MKKLWFLLFIIFLTSCPSDGFWGDDYDEDSSYSPVLMLRSNLEKSVEVAEATNLKNPGKIYVWQQYLIVVELYEGVHIFDNSNPEKPVNKLYINIPGCVDIAMKDGFLYADNATDLVTIDLRSMDDVKEASRQINVFPELLPPDMGYIPSKYNMENRPENAVIIGWQKKD